MTLLNLMKFFSKWSKNSIPEIDSAASGLDFFDILPPDLPGHRIRAFQGAKNLIEARVDGGFRVLLRDKGNGQWEVQDLGPDLYQH